MNRGGADEKREPSQRIHQDRVLLRKWVEEKEKIRLLILATLSRFIKRRLAQKKLSEGTLTNLNRVPP